ncbi:IS3 family transposase [Alkalicoccus saliphilus]|uniref:IS3 family transposase n=1 Tax=Alkalicoccus saliphilus TaxID=200989 RepID=UPI00135A4837|nr:IS3 family transposase [Alkalicoccus saliphilus]
MEGNRKEGSPQLGRHLHRYQAIDEYHADTGLPITLLCRVLGVSRSGYYKWRRYEPTADHQENTRLMTRIRRLFADFGGILGYRRLTMTINRRYKKQYNPKRILRLMRLLGLKSLIRMKTSGCTKTSYKNIEENLLEREFQAEAPNEKWVTDITYLRYGKGKKAYLSAIKDLYDGSIVAYHVGHFNDNDLVLETLRKAKAAHPTAHPLLHSDRGSQYTSKRYRLQTTAYQMERSMSRVGNCIDNAPIESFFSHLKTERYHRKNYAHFQALCEDIDDYIYFYNHERYQKKLNSLAPVEYRNQAVA